MIYRYESPLGVITYDWDAQLCNELWLGERSTEPQSDGDPVAKWLDAYFSEKSWPLPALAKPHSHFQMRLREALFAIPRGETRTYGELARELGTAPRALGQALGANPQPLLVPCHRVVAAHGMGGFSCGIAWKKALLEFERSF